jgi:hypothetical protein
MSSDTDPKRSRRKRSVRAGTEAALMTCLMRGWVEPLVDDLPTGKVERLFAHPKGRLFTGSELTDGSRNAINRPDAWVLIGVLVALLSLMVALAGYWAPGGPAGTFGFLIVRLWSNRHHNHTAGRGLAGARRPASPYHPCGARGRGAPPSPAKPPRGPPLTRLSALSPLVLHHRALLEAAHAPPGYCPNVIQLLT